MSRVVRQGSQRGILKGHADALDWSSHLLSCDNNFAGRWRQEACDKFHQRRFAAPTRADHGDKVSLGDLKREVLERQYAVVTLPIGQAHITDDYEWRGLHYI